MPIDGALVRELVAEIEGLKARQRQLSEDIRQVIARGRKAGVDGRALRIVLGRRNLSPEARRHIDGTVAMLEMALADGGVKFASSVFEIPMAPASAARLSAARRTADSASAARRPRGRPTKVPAIEALIEQHSADLAELPTLAAKARFLAERADAVPRTCEAVLRRASAAAQDGIDASAAA